MKEMPKAQTGSSRLFQAEKYEQGTTYTNQSEDGENVRATPKRMLVSFHYSKTCLFLSHKAVIICSSNAFPQIAQIALKPNEESNLHIPR